MLYRSLAATTLRLPRILSSIWRRRNWIVYMLDFPRTYRPEGCSLFIHFRMPRLNVSFHCSDVNALPLSGCYDVALASDLIEHMAPAELDCLYARLSSHLSPRGMSSI